MPKPVRSQSYTLRKSRRGLRAEAATAALERVRPESHVTPRPAPRTSLPPEVARQAQRDMDRLRRLPPGSAEAGQVRSYLQWLWSLPWDLGAPEDADLRQVELELERHHLGLAKAKERMIEYLAVRRLKPDLPGPALCLVGPPGTGKSSLGAAVARALRRPFVRTTVSGTSDASELRGISRTQAGAGPGKIVRALNEAGVNNPVLMIDGVDRLVGEGGLGVVEVLLELLDPESSVHFMDHYLDLSVDLSHAVMLFCANSLDMVPDSLQERLEVIEVPGYAEDEKLDIARRFLLPRQLAMICRKVARARATADMRSHHVVPGVLEEYIGHRQYTPETVGKSDEVGVAAGLAWTSTGGEILVVEALKMPGSGRVVTTGQLGEVMRESVQAAHSYVRSRADVLEIDAEAFSNFDIHIHFPAAGVPKDGPSAGITVGLVIASVLSDRPIRRDVAMSGEVSLRGKVLQVGGLREKALAAYRAGFRTMVFPASNVKNLDEIPKDVRERMEMVPVETMDDVFAVALHRIIVPQRVAGNYVLEFEDDDDEDTEVEETQDEPRAARGVDE